MALELNYSSLSYSASHMPFGRFLVEGLGSGRHCILPGESLPVIQHRSLHDNTSLTVESVIISKGKHAWEGGTAMQIKGWRSFCCVIYTVKNHLFGMHLEIFSVPEKRSIHI